MTDLKELKALAEKATKQHWIDKGYVKVETSGGGSIELWPNLHDPRSAEIADTARRFKDAVNSQAILSLIERIERYEEALRFIMNNCGHTPACSKKEWALCDANCEIQIRAREALDALEKK